MPLSPARHFHHRTIKISLGEIGHITNTQKTNGEPNKNVLNKSTTEIPRKRNKEIDDIEVNQMPHSEFKIMVIRMLNYLRRRMDNLSENLNKKIISIKEDMETINKNQSYMKIAIYEMKNLLEGK